MTPSILLTVNVHGIGPEARDRRPEELFARLAHGRYTYRVGLARMLDFLRDRSLAATFFWPASEASRVPALLERCLAEGHEIANHGHEFEDHEQLEPTREAELLEASHVRLRELAGTAPVGFRAPTGTLSHATLGILSRLGYLYDSSFVDDDAPYSLGADGAPEMTELPASSGLTDATYFRRRLTQRRVERHLTEELEALLPIAGYACITLHPRADIGLARASRLEVLERVIRCARAYGSSFKRCCDLVGSQIAGSRAS